MIAATRLRKGSTNSAKGAARLVADALVTARKAGATGQVTVRADSAYYNHDVIAAARTAGARFSITARLDAAVTRAITQIPDDAWVGITYPHAIWDQDEQRWVSDAQVAEIGFTAFTSRIQADHISARLNVRRVKRLNPKTVPTGQDELFSVWRHHAVFTDSREQMLAAEATHRDHAIVEKVRMTSPFGPTVMRRARSDPPPKLGRWIQAQRSRTPTPEAQRATKSAPDLRLRSSGAHSSLSQRVSGGGLEPPRPFGH